MHVRTNVCVCCVCVRTAVRSLHWLANMTGIKKCRGRRKEVGCPAVNHCQSQVQLSQHTHKDKHIQHPAFKPARADVTSTRTSSHTQTQRCICIKKTSSRSAHTDSVSQSRRRTRSSVLAQTGIQVDRVIMTSHSGAALGWKVRVIDSTQEEIYQCPSAQLWQEPNPLRAQCSNCSGLVWKHTSIHFRGGAAGCREGAVMVQSVRGQQSKWLECKDRGFQLRYCVTTLSFWSSCLRLLHDYYHWLAVKCLTDL